MDVLVGNEEDLQKGLGIEGPQVEATSKLDTRAFAGMMDNVVKQFPRVRIAATTLREVHSTSRHTWSAVAWINGKLYTAPTCELDVLDRVGGKCDGFASGFFYGLLAGELPEDALKPGWAQRSAALPHSPATRQWQRWIRCAHSQRAVRREFSDNNGMRVGLTFLLLGSALRLLCQTPETSGTSIDTTVYLSFFSRKRRTRLWSLMSSKR